MLTIHHINDLTPAIAQALYEDFRDRCLMFSHWGLSTEAVVDSACDDQQIDAVSEEFLLLALTLDSEPLETQHV